MTTPTTPDRKKGAAALGIAVALIATWEGTRTHAYLDSVHIATICTGHIHDVHMGDTATEEQCAAYLAGDLGSAYRTVTGAVRYPQPDTRIAALTSMTFNIGNGAFLRSTVLRKLNAGDVHGSCNAILRWNMAGGRVVQGLTNRREAERRLCLQ